MRSGNSTVSVRFNAFNGREDPPPPTAGSEDILLAQMEIFIIVVAVIAVAAALILLVLLQIRIKKQTTAENAANQSARVQPSQIEEIASDYPNDPFLKTGPPPYRQVMISPELYPLANTNDKKYGEVKIQIPTSPVHNERTKRTWNQFLNAVIRADEQGQTTPPGNYTTRDNTPASKDCTINVDIHNSIIDEVLPTYDEVCSRSNPGVTNNADYCQKTFPRRENVDVVKSGYYNILGFNFGVEKTKMCQKDCVFTISSALQTVITEELVRSSARRPRLATL